MTINRAAAALDNPPIEEMADDLSIEYPETDDMPMPDNDFQMTPITESLMTLRHQFRHRSDVYVAANMFVYYRMNDNRTRVAPDVYVVIGAAHKEPRASWLVWREGKAPDFVLEIASPSTWRYDVREKRRIYAEMGVTEYWRFDAAGRFFTPVLVGERLVDGEYQPIEVATDNDGILRGRSAVLALDICILPGLLLRFYDPEREQWLHTLEEEAAARQEEAAARQEAEAAQRQAEAAQQQEAAARQEAEASRQQAETARQQAETARQQSESARQQAEASRQQSESARQQAKAAQHQAEAAQQQAEAALQQEAAARQSLEDEVRRLRQQLGSGG